MDAFPVIILFSVVIGLGIVLWLLLFGLDRSRISEYIHQRGGRVVSIRWAPFGRGWFGEKDSRIYEVVYRDSEGNQHFATCKTSMWSGVYWTDDQITRRKSRRYDAVAPTDDERLLGERLPDDDFLDHSYPPDERRGDERRRKSPPTDIQAAAPSESLVDELRRLREENARLRRELEGRGD